MGEKDLIALEQYDITVLRAGKGREAMLCETDKGLMLLKEYSGSKERAEAEAWLLDKLSVHCGTDCYMRNKEGGVVTVLPDNRSYILKRWTDGREVDLKNTGELLMTVRALAKLHLNMNEVEKKAEEEASLTCFLTEGRCFTDDICRHHKELKHVRSYIRGKRRKSDFEMKVLECFNMFYGQSERLLLQVESEYVNGGKKDFLVNKRLLCHGNYNQHNILLNDKNICITNFDKACYNLQITDLYLLMRKCLEKQNWNSEQGIGMLLEYDRIKPVSREEREVLFILFLYPEKFWKIVNHYYNGNKTWVSQKSISKLQALMEQERERQKFLDRLQRL